MSKQQTAVEWLQDELEELFISTPYINWNKIFEKAKQKEKQQIIDAYETFLDTTLPNEVYEEYYNDKFGGGNK